MVRVNQTARSRYSEKFVFPTKCPSCENETQRSEGEAARKCVAGLVCDAQAIERLRHFVSKHAMDIDGLGEKQIKSFWDRGAGYKIQQIFSASHDIEMSLRSFRVGVVNR